MLLAAVADFPEHQIYRFQWAPTLGGECYLQEQELHGKKLFLRFNGHPPLGVNATSATRRASGGAFRGFNGHPPLGVNATMRLQIHNNLSDAWGFNGHPPLGVNATELFVSVPCAPVRVSMGTHPWG